MHGKKFGNHQSCIKSSINKIHIHILSGMTKIKVELFKRPAVSLSQVLFGGCDEGLGKNKSLNHSFYS